MTTTNVKNEFNYNFILFSYHFNNEGTGTYRILIVQIPTQALSQPGKPKAKTELPTSRPLAITTVLNFLAGKIPESDSLKTKWDVGRFPTSHLLDSLDDISYWWIPPPHTHTFLMFKEANNKTPLFNLKHLKEAMITSSFQ